MKSILLPLLLLLISCESTNQKAEKEIISEDIELLRKVINLDIANVQSVKWQQSKLGESNGFGPVDYRIAAVLTLEKEEIKQLKNSLEVLDESYLSLNERIIKTWFPQLLEKYLQERNEAFPLYSVEQFTKGAFQHGFCCIVGDNKLFVVLNTT